MRPALLPVVVGAALAGCGPSEGFGRLGPFKLQSGVVSFSNGADTALRYEVSSQGCQVLAPDFSVTVGGAPVPVRVGEHRYDGLTKTDFCDPPMFTIPRPRTFSSGAVSVEARSGDDAVTAQVEGLGMEIHGAPLLMPGEVPRVGQTLRIALEPGWDRLTWPGSGLISTDASLRASWTAAVTPPVDGVVEVTIPAEFPATFGPTSAMLQVWPRSSPSFTSCDAPLGCAIGSDVTGLIVVLKLTLLVQP